MEIKELRPHGVVLHRSTDKLLSFNARCIEDHFEHKFREIIVVVALRFTTAAANESFLDAMFVKYVDGVVHKADYYG